LREIQLPLDSTHILASGSVNGNRKVIAVIGDVMVDHYLSGRVDRLSPEAPIPVLLHNDDRTVAGGAANVAVNIAALGCEVRLVGLIGADLDGNRLKETLKSFGISVELLVVDSIRPTISKTRVVSGRHQFVRIDRETPGAPSKDVQEVIIKAARSAINDSDIVVLSDYSKGVLVDTVLGRVIDAAKSAGKLVLVDPKRRTFEGYRGADIIKPNLGELSLASGLPCRTDDEVEVAANALAAQFGGTLIVTRAEAGMSLFERGRPVRHFSTTVLEVADVSGAGDTALAALAVALAEGSHIEEATKYSNFAAGIAVSKLGTAVVSRSELNASIRRAQGLICHPGALVSKAAAAELALAWRENGECVVFTNGCFDLLHAGHIELLTSSAKQGDRLIVGLNSDASIKKLKGSGRPIQTQADRARIIGALRAVDLVVIFDELTPIALIEEISPDVLVKGADYAEDQVVGGSLVKARGGRVMLIPLVVDRSSTKIIESMQP
jgi:D-beta-D-heptose 7-phosphate kinase/D-beta-D-heptose 1-phosphate adenosyltransferase